MDRSFLRRLLDAPGPSGFEVRPARVWRAEAETFAESVAVDVNGNSTAAVRRQGSPRVMMAGHVDEIGLQVTHIDEEGYLYVDEIGGWDAQVLVGQRVKILSRNGDIVGVVGKKAIHLIQPDERSKASRTRDLWVDVGAPDRDAVLEMGLRVGDPMVLDQGMIELAGDRIASRAIDNRIGAFVVLEALRLLAEDPAEAGAFAVATAQEEIGYQGGGARSSAFALQPDVALVVDVTFSTDVPDVPKKELGEHKVGGGPVLSRGSAAHPVVFERLVEVADAEGIPYSLQASPRATRTDADGIHLTRAGVPTGLVSVPNRYMHSPNEVVSMGDLEHTARLLAAFVRSLDQETDFTPR
ncbi:MAG: M42 family metallopeptidase [Gemmatimonadetes bacterium]|nr:M42 family metallopeptidase [Gemmatimonadota bacterium]MBT8405766.1 M42 family metallopeptidase [Gemmatimonadota bacterium]NNF39713.1 M42 family metallopeptidase [Gemmatimonadota bacterium]